MRKKKALWLGVLALLALPWVAMWAPHPFTTSTPEGTVSLQSWPDHHLALPTDQAEGEDTKAQANLPFLFAVYTITWIAFFGYAFYLSRRQAELRQEIQALQEEVARRRQQSSQ
ncbi:MAG: CcmD family protein [Dehalococcoidia bacterium]|nr:CcmD family protein [Dehalococcoidia bacterium]